MRLLDLRNWSNSNDDMKLIHVDSSREEELKGNYAILSHTWGKGNDELLFHDLQHSMEKGRNKPGYDKVQKTCAQAREDGYHYAWVDTCCIDKTNPQELTEAINSMWRWYWDAGVCYAYLADVDGACPELKVKRGVFAIDDISSSEGRDWFTKLKESRWFKRGWTLQELLAPSNLKFYSSTWKHIGTKRDLIGILWDITGIDPIALEDRDSLRGFVIARKMSWAADRETSRIEDRAYSLMGIFEVQMPLLLTGWPASK
jgi:hypothetical protein